MKIKELIEILLNHDQELPVYLADWNEQYAPDEPLTAEAIHVEASLRTYRYGELTPALDLPQRLVLGKDGSGG